MGNMLDLLLMEVVKVMKSMSHGTLNSLPFKLSSHSTGPQIQDKSLTKCLGVLWTTFFNPFSQRKIYLSINFTKFQMFLEHESM